ncbi:AP-4 complex accessory subunit tepsin isoform X2 [Tyto alba]|uniref:AP-4 complex accessory subunit tepsin isoform X2 n=1 Tax=Tyto alba TaxID=56313 RepID=UPI001C6666C0|nr:AP-4 complex accessory subunit tepsin isoform X2 [Tyto alba]XP_042658672.1 AP-4 complex accessory subunit tepsin isoform X2 [Tyto alba]XP_042658673.1 AP-4 complex accessory subunit tepsin isoform X2 [Tyto alba]XP_042658674.1 AP-4 complex accessory subunit tepsin isoform X2 [Tyto alba]
MTTSPALGTCLRRSPSNSCRVKLKVLKILVHTCAQGSPHFVLQLKRNACFIREAAAFTGPPDPLHGNSLNQKVRVAAQDLAGLIFSDAPLPQPATLPARPVPPAGMGSSPSPCGSLQGFGFSSEKSGSASTGEALLSTIQRAAEAVAHAVLPSPEGPRPHRRELHEDAYEPVRAPSPPRSAAGALKPPAPTAAHSTRVRHQPGLAGGGWEEADSGHSSQDSSQGNGELSRTSDSCSKSGSDSHSGASRELSHAAERVDADSLGDCVREVSLVSALTRGARVFLTREEAQHFVKECGLLNCEVVLELLGRALEDPSDSVRMRSMCAISSLMCSDLLSLDQIFAVTRQHLQQLSQGSPGPVANRATKILRQFEALCRGQPPPKSAPLDSDPSALTAGSAPCAGDLLTDIPPLTGESILTPLSPAPLPPAAPARGEEEGVEAETPEQPGAAVPACPCEPEVTSRLAGDTVVTAVPSHSLSLFAGMELVARPGAVLCPDSPPAEPRTRSGPEDRQMDAEGSRQPSAFAFLNM